MGSPGVEESQPTVHVHRGKDEVVQLDDIDSVDFEKLRSFLLKEGLPPFGKITDDNYLAYAMLAEQGLLWVCFAPGTVEEDAERFGTVFREVAETFQQFRVAYIDANEYKEHVEEELGCTEFPSVVLQLGNFSNLDVELKHYRTVLSGELTTEVVAAWIR